MADVPRSPYWTVAETAAYLRVSARSVYEMVARGEVDYIRTGGPKRPLIRITRASVERLLVPATATTEQRAG